MLDRRPQQELQLSGRVVRIGARSRPHHSRWCGLRNGVSGRGPGEYFPHLLLNVSGRIGCCGGADMNNQCCRDKGQRAVEELQSLPEEQRSQAVSTQLAPEALLARGVPIRQGMTITTQTGGTPDEPIVRTVEAGTTQPGIPGPILPLDGRICFWLFGQQVCIDLPIFPPLE